MKDLDWFPIVRFLLERDPSKSEISANTKHNLPPSVFASKVEDDVGLLNKAAPRTGPRVDWDPDIVETLDDDFANYDAVYTLKVCPLSLKVLKINTLKKVPNERGRKLRRSWLARKTVRMSNLTFCLLKQQMQELRRVATKKMMMGGKLVYWLSKKRSLMLDGFVLQ